MTVESIAWIRNSDKVLYVVGDPIAEDMIRTLNPGGAESMTPFYAEGKPRLDTYNEMIEHTLSFVRSGLRTCVAYYGHPGIFVFPSHQAIGRARSEGYPARMLPGISAEDCLFADLGIDPAMSGCQSYEATDFLLSNRRIDPSSSLVLWQVGVVGDWTYKRYGYGTSGLPLLIERLCQHYTPVHTVYVYEAAIFLGCEPVIQPVPLCRLGEARLSASSTLFVPAGQPPAPDPVMYQRLNIAMGNASPA